MHCHVRGQVNLSWHSMNLLVDLSIILQLCAMWILWAHAMWAHVILLLPLLVCMTACLFAGHQALLRAHSGFGLVVVSHELQISHHDTWSIGAS